MDRLNAGEGEEVTMKGSVITGRLRDAKNFKTYAAEYPELVRTLREKNVKITVKPEEQNPWYWNLFFSYGPIILLIVLWVLFMRQMQTGGNQGLLFGHEKDKV